ncbi:hypothetical protein SAMN02745116_01727 [Pilibacter termitis]|uniref:Uncharacterized protein n=2 Tax=Pilibacter termitis TaxID=263852 RepID=A0A1T4PD71_9ENTE|nr:hypothetical protein SAMN02745116_01727 [Pilibacter termitis]
MKNKKVVKIVIILLIAFLAGLGAYQYHAFQNLKIEQGISLYKSKVKALSKKIEGELSKIKTAKVEELPTIKNNVVELIKQYDTIRKEIQIEYGVTPKQLEKYAPEYTIEEVEKEITERVEMVKKEQEEAKVQAEVSALKEYVYSFKREGNVLRGDLYFTELAKGGVIERNGVSYTLEENVMLNLLDIKGNTFYKFHINDTPLFTYVGTMYHWMTPHDNQIWVSGGVGGAGSIGFMQRKAAIEGKAVYEELKLTQGKVEHVATRNEKEWQEFVTNYCREKIINSVNFEGEEFILRAGAVIEVSANGSYTVQNDTPIKIVKGEAAEGISGFLAGSDEDLPIFIKESDLKIPKISDLSEEDIKKALIEASALCDDPTMHVSRDPSVNKDLSGADAYYIPEVYKAGTKVYMDVSGKGLRYVYTLKTDMEFLNVKRMTTVPMYEGENPNDPPYQSDKAWPIISKKRYGFYLERDDSKRFELR